MARAKGISPELKLVFWESTAGCNLACKHCRRLDVSRELSKSDLDTAEAFRMVDQIAVFSKPVLVLSGGEPLMRPDIFEIASRAAGSGLPVALATNGTLVDAAIAARIRRAGVSRVSVSLDGAAAGTHDGFRGLAGSFDRAVEGIRLLRAENVEVQINFTLARHNAEEIDEIYDLSLKLGAVALHIFMLVPVGCGVSLADTEMLSPAEYEEKLARFYELSKERRLQMKATCAPHYYRIMRQKGWKRRGPAAGHPQGLDAVTRGCLAGSAVCFISHEGEVFPCGYLPVSAGNIRREPLEKIWNESSVFDMLRKPELLGGKCGRCEFRAVCMGCRARAFHATGDFMEEEPFCAYTPGRKG